jgi:ABC-2 type transport system permease protein
MSVAQARKPAPGPLLPMLLAQTYAQLLGYLRTPAFSVTSLALPLMLFVFFGLPNAQKHFPDGSSVGAYLLASFGAYAVSSMMVFSFGIGVAQARGLKVDLLQRATPLPPAVAISANILNALVFALAALILLFLFGALVGGVAEPVGVWFNLTWRLLIGAIPLIGLGMSLGYSAGPGSAPAVVNLIYLPMAFASGIFIPIDQMPDFIQKLAPWLPLYHYAQLGWGVVGHANESLSRTALALGIWTVILLVLAVRAYSADQQRKFR